MMGTSSRRIAVAALAFVLTAVMVAGCGWRGLNSLPLPGTEGGGSGAFTIQAQMGDGLRFVFRNFPITSSHPHAEKAAEAAEAASAQGRFWEMHDHLYEHQQQLTGEHLHAHAQVLGLDLKRFDQDLADNVYAPRVREDLMSGVRSGVNGTPTFFINGVRYDGSHDLDSLLAAVRSAT